MNGGRADANNWTVDGADNIDRGANGNLLTYPSLDAIAEFKVLSSAYSAEFGRSAGGQVNVVTNPAQVTFMGMHMNLFAITRLPPITSLTMPTRLTSVRMAKRRFHPFDIMTSATRSAARSIFLVITIRARQNLFLFFPGVPPRYHLFDATAMLYGK